MKRHYFIHEYKGLKYYIPLQELSEAERNLNYELYGTSHGINQMIIEEEGEYTELTSNSVIFLNIKEDI